MKVLQTVTCKAELLPRGTSGAHPLVIVLNKLVEHVNGEHLDKRQSRRGRIENKCCRPFRTFEDAAKEIPEVGFKPRARRTSRGHKGSTS